MYSNEAERDIYDIYDDFKLKTLLGLHLYTKSSVVTGLNYCKSTSTTMDKKANLSALIPHQG